MGGPRPRMWPEDPASQDVTDHQIRLLSPPIHVGGWQACGMVRGGRQSGPQRSTKDLSRALRQQYGFLVRSGRDFDKGERDEAARLSAVLRMLVHDGQGPSLLGMLRMTKRLRMMDSAGHPNPRNLLPNGGLTIVELTAGSGRLIAPLDDLSPDRLHPNARLGHWWKMPVIGDSARRLHSRRDVVLAAAHTDGGAHVSRFLDVAYDELTKDNLGWTAMWNGVATRIGGDVAAASIRQTAHEMQRTLEREVPELLAPKA